MDLLNESDCPANRLNPSVKICINCIINIDITILLIILKFWDIPLLKFAILFLAPVAALPKSENLAIAPPTLLPTFAIPEPNFLIADTPF